MWNRLSHKISLWLHQPLKVLWICALVAGLSLVMDGSFLRLWGLYKEQTRLEQRLVAAHQQTKVWETKIARAQEPSYIERQARDQLDLVKEGDLVFVFADDSQP